MKIKNRINDFRMIYGIATGAAVLIILIGLAVFYDLIAAYELSQPQGTAEKYVSTLTEDTVIGLAEDALGELEMVYEDRDEYIGKYRAAWSDNTPICRKHIKSSSAEAPVYSVMCGDTEVCRLTLKGSGDGKYGLDGWLVERCEFPLSSVTDNGKRYSVYAPKGARITVNGTSLSSPSRHGAVCPMLSELDPDARSAFALYELGTLYAEPDITCTLGDDRYCVTVSDGTVLCSAEAPLGYVICAPEDADVYVNGNPVGSEYVTETGVPYKYSEFEAASDDLPAQAIYETGYMLSAPEVRVSLGGIDTRTELDGLRFTAAYPERLMCSITVKAPVGTELLINGIPAGEAAYRESAFEGLSLGTATVPEYEVFKADGLYSPTVSITGALDGAALTFAETVVESERGILREFATDRSVTLDGDTSRFALDFADAYFHYTSEGRRDLGANLAAVLGYVDSGSELYTKLKSSGNGYSYIAPATGEVRNVLEITDAYVLDDGSAAVKINFDIDRTNANATQKYAGDLLLHITGGDSRRISAMVINNK